MTTDTLVRERPLTRVGQHGLAGSDGQAIRPKFELVKVEDQMPLDVSEVVDLVLTEALRAAADKRRAILDHIPPNKPEARSVETSRLKLAERELRFREWRDEQLAQRPPGCQPWCLGLGRRSTSRGRKPDDAVHVT